MQVETQDPDTLIIDQVSKSFLINGQSVDILQNVNLNIKQGEFVSIIGPSGCGKSTLLRLIVGLELGFSGKISLNNRPIQGANVDRGMVFQEARLYPWLTVEENIIFGLPETYSKADATDLVAKHLELVGLKNFAKAYPYQLSGGMQQRASIARALINRPQVLLLDEPFGALDAITRIQMQQEIIRIWQAEKTTILLVTHDIDEAVFLGDKVVIMSQRPATVKSIIPVDLPRPRDRNSYDFMNLRKLIYSAFFVDAETPFSYNI